VLRTADGGNTWTIAGSSAPAGNRWGVGYIGADNSIALATGPSGYGVSLDEGATWTALDTTGYNTLGARGSVAWLAGSRGRILRLDARALRNPPARALDARALRNPPARGQTPTNFSPELANAPAMRDALKWLDSNFNNQVVEWIRITEIPGTSRHEQQRAAYVRAEMEKEGLSVTVDSIGNVIGVRKGSGNAPSVVFAAHLDTVHPLDTDVRVKRDGKVLRAPGIFDNSASVANMLATIRALNKANIRTQGDLVSLERRRRSLVCAVWSTGWRTTPVERVWSWRWMAAWAQCRTARSGFTGRATRSQAPARTRTHRPANRTRRAPWLMRSARSTRSRFRAVEAVRSTTSACSRAGRSSTQSLKKSPSRWISAR
jgi:hypothetical protein